MNKSRVLAVLAQTRQFMSPSDVCRGLHRWYPRSSVCSYLLRLQRQGLLERYESSQRVFYRITHRGIERLAFLQARELGRELHRG